MQPDENTPASQPVHLLTLGRRIKAVRKSWRWPQERMAYAMRVDQASVSFWERDKITPSGSAMVALAALFRTTADALETGKNFVMPAAPITSEFDKNGAFMPRGICLPINNQPGMLTVVDLNDGGLMSQPLSEAMMNLGQYARDGRKIWIVVE